MKFKFLVEELLLEASGLNTLLLAIKHSYPETKNYVDHIENFIINSGCKNISLEMLEMRAKGLALHDRVVLNISILREPLVDFLFVLFHEIAHQYQYKKYGEDKMYEVYLGNLSLEKGAEWMYRTEIIADEFATRKLREFVKLGLIDSNTKIPKGFYKIAGPRVFINLIKEIREKIKKSKMKDKNDISELIYNMVKNNV